MSAAIYGYIGFYKGKKVEVYAVSIIEARRKAAIHFKAKELSVNVVLAEKNGKPVVHIPLY